MVDFDFYYQIYIYHLHSSTLHGWQEGYTQQSHSLGLWSSIYVVVSSSNLHFKKYVFFLFLIF
jgi:hypothetical protein